MKKDALRVGYGTFKLGRNEQIKYPNAYLLPSQAEATRLIECLYVNGVQYFDTAPSYGDAERKLGQALQSIGVPMSERWISTKFGEYFDPKSGAYYHDFSPQRLRQSVERSLNELQTDYIDVLYIHAFFPELKIVQNVPLLDALQLLRSKGVIRGMGLSGYTNEAFSLIFNELDAAMVEYHPNKKDLLPTIERFGAAGKSVVIKKVLSSGMLRPEESLSYVLSNPYVGKVLMTSLNWKHIQQNLDIIRDFSL